MKKRVSVILLILAVILSFTACNGLVDNQIKLVDVGVSYVKAADMTKNPGAAAQREDSIIVSSGNFSGIWNLLYTNSVYDNYAMHLMFDFNIEYDFDGKPVAGVTDFEVSQDGKTYTFKIKDGIEFWDASKVKAQDLEFVYYLLADPEYDGIYDISWANIEGYNEYKTGDATEISGIKVIDEKTLEVKLSEVNAAAIFSLRIPVLSKNHYAPDFNKGEAADVKAKNSEPMGTGQYKYVSYKDGELLTLEANDKYFKGNPKIKKVLFSITAEGQDLQRLISGEVDIAMPAVSEDNMGLAKDAGFIDVYRYPSNSYGFLALNNKLEKFKDVRVRQALAYAINRAQVVQQVFGPYAKVINIPESSVSWAYDDEGLNTYEYNREKAAHLLDEAGWKLNANGKREKNGEALTIKFSCMAQNAFTDKLNPVMLEEFTKLGMDLVVENLEWTALNEKAAKGELESYFLVFGVNTDPSDLNYVFKSDGVQNSFFGYSNPDVDKLLEDGVIETDFEKRKDIYKQVYQKLNNDLPMIPLYQRSDMWVVNGRIKGIELSSYRELFYNLYKCSISK